jgi:hypothetical protein
MFHFTESIWLITHVKADADYNRVGLDSWSRAGFWKNDTAAVLAVRTIQ